MENFYKFSFEHFFKQPKVCAFSGILRGSFFESRDSETKNYAPYRRNFPWALGYMVLSLRVFLPQVLHGFSWKCPNDKFDANLSHTCVQLVWFTKIQFKCKIDWFTWPPRVRRLSRLHPAGRLASACLLPVEARSNWNWLGKADLHQGRALARYYTGNQSTWKSDGLNGICK